MKTLAVPPALVFSQPIQLTDVPVKMKVTVAFCCWVVAAQPSVQTLELL
jgi:hypothetical protein